MQYPRGYAQNGYAGYAGYGEAPPMQASQTHQGQFAASPHQQHHMQQHPMVVIPQEQRQSAPPFRTTPQLYQPQQPQFSHHHPTQQQRYPQPQHYYPQPQQYFPQPALPRPQAPVHLQSGPVSQTQYYTAPLQNFYDHSGALNGGSIYAGSQTVPGCQPQTPSDHVPFQQPLSHSQDYSAKTSRVFSSPDPLQTSSPQLPSRAARSPPQTKRRSDIVPAQPRVSQPSRASYGSQSTQGETPKQRIVARVEIPALQSSTESMRYDMMRPQKRRRSNEGRPIPLQAPAEVHRRSSPQPPAHRLPSSSPLTELASSQLPPPPTPDVDYRAILLALADEYITAAYALGPSIATGSNSTASQEQYSSLMATAMGCMQSVLNNYHHSDHRKEARLRLRLAALMIEETENFEEAEQVLSKGIALCERGRLPDLKYAMHLLLVRLTFLTSPKAALKALDKLVQEVEALSLIHWMYTLRFLRVSLSLDSSLQKESHSILKHLSAISAAAEAERHISVTIVAAIFEAVVHLRNGAADAGELAQRALTGVRAHQLSSELQQMPQIGALMDCLDLACSLSQFNLHQVETKMQHMHANLDSLSRQPGWSKDGTVLVELDPSSSDSIEEDTGGLLRKTSAGQVTLPFLWLKKDQLYALGFLLSGSASTFKTPDGTKAGTYLQEGLKLCERQYDTTPQSLSDAIAESDERFLVGIAIRLQVASSLCARSEFAAAQEAVARVRKNLGQRGSDPDDSTMRTMLYIEALSRHGQGELRSALDLYGSPQLTFDPDSKTDSSQRDLRILATLNRVLILRTLKSDDLIRADTLINMVEPHCLNHPNAAIKAACCIIRATAAGTNGVMKTKQYLQAAIDAAKASTYNQLLSIVMNIMTSTMFTNIVGEQAEKSVRAAASLAKKSRHSLWMTVADGMYGEIMERCGKVDEAFVARKEAQSLMPSLPKPLQAALSHG